MQWTFMLLFQVVKNGLWVIKNGIQILIVEYGWKIPYEETMENNHFLKMVTEGENNYEKKSIINTVILS